MTSPSTFLEWDEPAVQSWLAQQGYGQYEDQVIEQGINGEALSMLDLPTLQELGITSIGHRLGILKAVFQLKLEQGIELGDDDWRPADEPRLPSASIASNTPSAPHFPPSISYPPNSGNVDGGLLAEYVASPSSASGGGAEGGMWGVILEQNERIAALERSYKQLYAILSQQPAFRATNGHSLAPRGFEEGRMRREGSRDSEREDGMGMGMGVRDDEEEGTLHATPSASKYIPFPSPSHQTPPQPPPLPVSAQPIPESSVLSPSTQSAFDPSTSTAPVPMSSKPTSSQTKTPPALNRMISATGITGTPLTANSFTPNTAGLGTPTPTGQTVTTPTPSSKGGEGARDARDAAGAAAKSFRVTLEDPCWKVLPAALKKYKINDDWRMYAMFICFGNTERCLSYDEKPLLLFQKLKEANQKPVFMLRHIRDIKSPIAVAQQKQAARATLKPSSATTPGGHPQPADSTTPTSSTNPHPYSKDTRLHRPPVLQPISAKARAVTAGNSTPGSGNGTGSFPDLPSPGLRTATAGVGSLEGQQGEGEVRKLSYAVAIYPYSAEREDEFDVAVGAAFIICNKAKGWWVVQKDPDGSGGAVIDESQTGWVPAGCLLELSEPLQSIARNTNWDASAHPTSTQPIPPTYVLSSSFAGIALMDYQKKGEDELDLKKDDLVRVFKRYNHWSAAIITSTGERGWVPSWYIGKKQAEGEAEAEKEKKEKEKSAESVEPSKLNDGRV